MAEKNVSLFFSMNKDDDKPKRGSRRMRVRKEVGFIFIDEWKDGRVDGKMDE